MIISEHRPGVPIDFLDKPSSIHFVFSFIPYAEYMDMSTIQTELRNDWKRSTERLQVPEAKVSNGNHYVCSSTTEYDQPKKRAR